MAHQSYLVFKERDLFCHRGKGKLGFGLFIHELAQGAFDFVIVSLKSM